MTCACPTCRPGSTPEQPTGERVPMFSAEELAEYSPADRAFIARREAEEVQAVAYHEAGHAIVGLATGYSVAHATTETAHPHARFQFGVDTGFAPTVAHRLMMLLAGPMAEAVARRRFRRPCREEVAEKLTLVREHGAGTCDFCQVAQLLLDLAPLADDEARQTAWLLFEDTTFALFERLDVRIPLGRVAAALERDVVLSGEQVEALVDVPALRVAVEAVLAEAAQPETLPSQPKGSLPSRASSPQATTFPCPPPTPYPRVPAPCSARCSAWP